MAPDQLEHFVVVIITAAICTNTNKHVHTNITLGVLYSTCRLSIAVVSYRCIFKDKLSILKCTLIDLCVGVHTLSSQTNTPSLFTLLTHFPHTPPTHTLHSSHRHRPPRQLAVDTRRLSTPLNQSGKSPYSSPEECLETLKPLLLSLRYQLLTFPWKWR